MDDLHVGTRGFPLKSKINRKYLRHPSLQNHSSRLDTLSRLPPLPPPKKMSTDLPSGLSSTFWHSWSPARLSASVPESLDPGEEWIGGWDNVGLYEGSVILCFQSISASPISDLE